MRNLTNAAVWCVMIAICGITAYIWSLSLDFNALIQASPDLLAEVAANTPKAAIIFILGASIILLCPLPIGSLVCLSSGLFFGAILGTVLMTIATLASGTVLFFLTRTARGLWLRERALPWLERIENYCNENPVLNVIGLRLMPFLPFFVVCGLAALLRVPYKAYVIGSIIGSAPGLFLLAFAGDKLQYFIGSDQNLGEPELVSDSFLILLAVMSVIVLGLARFKYRNIDKTKIS